MTVVAVAQNTNRKPGEIMRIRNATAATAIRSEPTVVAPNVSTASAVHDERRRELYSPNPEKEACHSTSRAQKSTKFPTFIRIAKKSERLMAPPPRTIKRVASRKE